jgi:outer membrane lipase/esterase
MSGGLNTMSIRTLALASAAVAALAGAAHAQTANTGFTRLVVFGDSLSDDGNLAAFNAAPPPPYFGGRFADGPVYTELLGFGPFGAPGTTTGSVNYAFGGARTDTLVAVPPGLAAQFAQFRAAGGSFGPNDLVIAWGGANDIFQTFPTAASNPATALSVLGGAAVQAAANQAALTRDIIAAGGRTILVGNLPDLGRTPQFAGLGASAAQLASAGGGVFNSELAARLNAVAAANPSANVILFDTARGLAAITANPAAFGLTNVTQPCFTGTSVCATPGTYLYWDGVHPTAAGQRITAALATDYLTYDKRGGAATLLSETSLLKREEATDAVFQRLADRELGEGGLFLTVDGGATGLDARGFVPGIDMDGYTVRLGGEHGFEGGSMAGVQVSFGRAEAKADSYAFDVETFGADAYYGWRSAGLFVNASVGGGTEKFDDIERRTAVAPVVHTASSRGWNFGGKLQAGTWFDLGALAVSPRAALSAVKAQNDGYTENGLAARHRVLERKLEAVFAEGSLRAELPLGALSGFAEVGYRTDLSYEGDAVRVGLFENPARVLESSVEDLAGGVGLVDAGISGRLSEGLSLSLAYRGRFGDAWDSQQGRVGLTLAF